MATGSVSHPVVIFVFILYGAAILKNIEARRNGNGENSKFNWISNRHRDFNALLEDKGPNICASEVVSGQPRRNYYSECMSYAPARVCQKPTFIRYHCCTGFEAENRYARGCTVEKLVVNLNETMLDQNLNDFHQLWTNLDKSLHVLINEDEKRVVTMFVPQSFNFTALSADIKAELSKGNTNDNLLYHQIVFLRYKSSDLINNAVIQSKYKGGAPIRIHRYAGGILTANCVRVVLPDQMATNGIIHITENFIRPMKKSDWEVILGDPRLSKFKDYLTQTKLDQRLQQPGCLTVFAPTNDAFTGLDDDVKDIIEGNPELLKRLLLYHMIDCCICSSAILTHSNPATLEGEKLFLQCDVKDRFVVDDAVAIVVDHVTENGIVHIIDKVLVPDAAKSVRMKLEEQDLHEFLALVEEAGMTGLLSGKANITVLAPTNPSLEGQFEDLTFDEEYLKAFVLNHVIGGSFPTSKLIGTHFLKTMNEDKNYSSHLFVNVYHREFGINNVLLVKVDYEMANGIVHVIDTPLIFSSALLSQKIHHSESLSLFGGLLNTSKLNLDTEAIGPQWTVLAPINRAMDRLGQATYLELNSSKELAAEFVRKHLIKTAIFPNRLMDGVIHKYYNENHKRVDIEITRGTEIRVDKTCRVLSHDIGADNGILFVIDKVIK